MSNKIVSLGKQLAFLLRHDKDSYDSGLIDKNGWRLVSELVKHGYTSDILDEIVNTNDKKRYEYNSDKSKIRARQGHSIPVDVGLKETTPLDVLYHGTATRFMDSIYEKGLIPGSRLYVHLSADKETATKVGVRHGKMCIITIDCKKMSDDGAKFYLSNNGVWLTDTVNPKYFISVE